MGRNNEEAMAQFDKEKTDTKCTNYDRCHNYLTKSEKEISKTDGRYWCSACRRDWDKIQKE